MKKLIVILAVLLLKAGVFAQTPEKMSYQAVIRNSNNALITNTQIGMQISILQGSASGTAVYTEIQTPATNANGLVSIEIGGGPGFSTIDWANGPFFIKTETDPTGGTNYTITGTSQLLSVPYALHAKKAESITGSITEIDPIFSVSVASSISSMDTANWNNKLNIEIQSLADVIEINNLANSQIKNVYSPTEEKDAVNKAYVDVLLSKIDELEANLKRYGSFPYDSGDSVTFIYNGNEVTYGTIEYDGKVWMDRNLGAKRVATSYNDADSYGDLFQWGREDDGHQIRTSETIEGDMEYTYQPGNSLFITEQESPYDWGDIDWNSRWAIEGIKTRSDVCPTGWKVPTKEDWESASTNWNNNMDAFTSALKLPTAGIRNAGGIIDHIAKYGAYWCSTTYDFQHGGWFLYFYNEEFGSPTNASVGAFDCRAYGYSVRCISEE